MGREVKEKVFLAKMNEVPQVIDYVVATAQEADVHPKRIMHIQLAVEEAIVNIFKYAYEIPPGEVLVRTWREKEEFTIVFVDEGIPFDPLSVEEPDLKTEIEERGVGGLGIFLIRRIMDEVYYRREDGKNILGMVVRNAP